MHFPCEYGFLQCGKDERLRVLILIQPSGYRLAFHRGERTTELHLEHDEHVRFRTISCLTCHESSISHGYLC